MNLLHLQSDGQDIRVVLDRHHVVHKSERLHLGLSMDKRHLFGQDGGRIEL